MGVGRGEERYDMGNPNNNEGAVRISSGNGGLLGVILLLALFVLANIAITATLLGMYDRDRGEARPASGVAPQPPPPAQLPVLIQAGGGASPMGPAGGSPGGQKVNLIQVSSDYGAFDFIDDQGAYGGFHNDLIKAVCTAAGIQCAPVVGHSSDCFISEPGKYPRIGTGLAAGYVDGCLGWSPTVERVTFAKFSSPYIKTLKTYFFYKDESSPFDGTNFKDKKIGLLAGFLTNDRCIKRLFDDARTNLPASNVINYEDAAALNDAIQNEEVHAGFGLLESMERFVTEKKLYYHAGNGNANTCALAGDALAVRKNSMLTDAWNRGLNQILNNGEFKKLCDKAASEYASKGTLDCVPSYTYN